MRPSRADDLNNPRKLEGKFIPRFACLHRHTGALQLMALRFGSPLLLNEFRALKFNEFVNALSMIPGRLQLSEAQTSKWTRSSLSELHSLYRRGCKLRFVQTLEQPFEAVGHFFRFCSHLIFAPMLLTTCKRALDQCGRPETTLF